MKLGREVMPLKATTISQYNTISATIPKWQTFKLFRVDTKLAPLNVGP
jgi:hypothetical protein